MKITWGLAAPLLLSALPAQALQQCVPSKEDSRIRYCSYNPSQVYEIWTLPGAELEVQFSSEEVVQEGNIGVTDGDGFIRQPRGNFMYLKAKRCMVPKPILVTTKLPDGTLRPYRFQFETKSDFCDGADYKAAPPQVTPASMTFTAPVQHTGMEKFVDAEGLNPSVNAIMSAVFKYPGDEAQQRAAKQRVKEAAAQKQQAQTLLKQQTSWPYGNPWDGSWNYRYVAHGSMVAPAQIRDNGYQTVFLFPQMQRVPSLFRIQPGAARCNRERDEHNEATEIPSVHRSGADGDTIIAQGTAPGWCLRDGATVLEVLNLGYTIGGSTPSTGTVSPYVKRTLKGDTEPDEPPAPVPLRTQGASADGR